MTTAAYSVKHGEIAVDSQLCRGSVIISDNCNKIISNNNGLFILAGDHEATLEVSKTYPEPPSCSGDCSGFAVIDGVVFWVYYGKKELYISLCEYDEATGMGQEYALALMDTGMSPLDAVKGAIKRDVYSGGVIRVLNVKTGHIELFD